MAAPNVRLKTPGRAENVLLVREMLSGLAAAVRLDGVSLGDIRTAVTEAANNVVMHAYPDSGEGPLEVEASVLEGEVRVVVRDRGRGIAEDEAASEEGIGLGVVRALASRLHVAGEEDAGTEVVMSLPAPGVAPPVAVSVAASRPAPPLGTEEPEPGETLLEISPPALLPFVLPRMLSVLAAQARFSTDRIADTAILADALVAHTARAVEGPRLRVAAHIPETRRLVVALSPLLAERTAAALDGGRIEGLGAALRSLGDGFTVRPLDGATEALEVWVRDPGPPGREHNGSGGPDTA